MTYSVAVPSILPLHAPELELPGLISLWKGSRYGLSSDMIDWNSRMLNIPRTQNQEAVHVPLSHAFHARLSATFEQT
jgi:hypothetical protein